MRNSINLYMGISNYFVSFTSELELDTFGEYIYDCDRWKS